MDAQGGPIPNINLSCVWIRSSDRGPVKADYGYRGADADGGSKLSLDDPSPNTFQNLLDSKLRMADAANHAAALAHAHLRKGRGTDEEAKAASMLSDLVPAFASKPLAFEPEAEMEILSVRHSHSWPDRRDRFNCR